MGAKSWRKGLLCLALFLFAGAAMNTAAAVGCARWSPFDRDVMLSSPEVEQRLPEQVERRPEYTDFRGLETLGFGHSELRTLAIVLDADGRELAVPLYYHIVSGWPMFSLEGSVTLTSANGVVTRCVALMSEAGIGRGETPDIPLCPLWPGFGINTFLYASILWLLARGPFTLRRAIRSKRGLCIDCGYDLRRNVAERCPECGWRRKETQAALST